MCAVSSHYKSDEEFNQTVHFRIMVFSADWLSSIKARASGNGLRFEIPYVSKQVAEFNVNLEPILVFGFSPFVVCYSQPGAEVESHRGSRETCVRLCHLAATTNSEYC